MSALSPPCLSISSTVSVLPVNLVDRDLNSERIGRVTGEQGVGRVTPPQRCLGVLTVS